MKEKILLHACCAICAGHPITLLQEEGFEPIAYFFNPNIYPSEEFSKRLKAMEKLCENLNCDLIIEKENPELYSNAMLGYENHKEGSERCTKCFELRMLKTAFKTKELGYKKFTTTLSVSPHKNFNTIKKIGDDFARYCNLTFIDHNFKKQDGFLKTTKIANSLELYKQNYCGCANSINR